MEKDNFALRIALGLLVTIICVYMGFRRPLAPPKPQPITHVFCETTKGAVEIVVMPEWSPIGAHRFLEMVDDGYFMKLPLFRCIPNFVCQMGPAFKNGSNKIYNLLPDDPSRSDLRDFKPGFLSFAGYAANSRATHIFIALAAVPSLGSQTWETPFGYITEAGMKNVVSQFETSYGDTEPTGHGPKPEQITAADGEEFLQKNFPKLDYFQSCVRK